ncbi:MAG: hypothetical protein LBN39_07470 [Planctomycetaceae bacterium]|nr:hypothetical protein [Planctomycetaceae bacterium]
MNLFGLTHRAEFREVMEFLNTVPPSNVRAECSVLLQSYPFEFPQKFVNMLINAEPLLPVILVAGAGCEGEVRTGRPLQGVFRIYASQWTAYRNELERFFNGGDSVFLLPRTAGNDEIAVFLFSPVCPRQPLKDTVVL